MEEKKEILSLEDFLKSAKKHEGVEVIDAVQKENYGDVIPCTSFSLRNALGIGGFAKRKLYTIDGEYSSGKSTTSYDVIGNCIKTFGDQCLLIDKEDSYTTNYGKKIGIDNSKLTILTPHTLEDMYDILIDALKSNLFGVIVVDSVTSFAPEARFEGSVVLGIEARVNSDKMRLVMDALYKSNTCLIFIQQTRQKLNLQNPRQDPTTTSGGTAIPFYAHVRVRITRCKLDRVERKNIMKFTVIKNKLAPAFKIGTIVFDWDAQSLNFASEIAQLAVEFGVIKNEKTTYFLPDTDIKLIGKNKVASYLEDNPEYVKNILEPLVIEVLNTQNPIRLDEGDEELN